MNQTMPPTCLIPDQLLGHIKKGDCVLFLGDNLPLGYPGAPLSRPELAQALERGHARVAIRRFVLAQRVQDAVFSTRPSQRRPSARASARTWSRPTLSCSGCGSTRA